MYKAVTLEFGIIMKLMLYKNKYIIYTFADDGYNNRDWGDSFFRTFKIIVIIFCWITITRKKINFIDIFYLFYYEYIGIFPICFMLLK